MYFVLCVLFVAALLLRPERFESGSWIVFNSLMIMSGAGAERGLDIYGADAPCRMSAQLAGEVGLKRLLSSPGRCTEIRQLRSWMCTHVFTHTHTHTLDMYLMYMGLGTEHSIPKHHALTVCLMWMLCMNECACACAVRIVEDTTHACGSAHNLHTIWIPQKYEE